VVEKNEQSVNAVYCLDDETWFLVQTNYDRNKPDNPKDCRRNPAENYLENIGDDNFKPKDLHDLLTSAPNFVQKEQVD
jgi:acid ceramidase/N-acylethanolamine-hydrolysing acid amidase